MRTLLFPFLLVLVAPISATAANHADWPSFMKANRYKCPGPFDTLSRERKVKLAGKRYVHRGYKLEVQSRDDDARVVIGVMSALKDVSKNTKQNVSDALAWFRSRGVEWVIVNGDIAIEELDLEDAIDLLGESGLPTLLVLGNSESRSSFARAYASRADKYPNLVNGTWVRQVVADDAEFWTLPGYYSKSFVYQGAGCRYKKEDVDSMRRSLDPAGEGPVVLVSHGPPRGKGVRSIDVITDKTNVGDEAMAELITKKGIPFGVFGHILESGGRAVSSDLKTPVAPEKRTPSLFLNAGSVSGDPWGMNDGSTSYGMAMLVVIDGGKATYEVKRFPSRF
ncbi:MAG: metallophosphoesterase [Myxococcota bacterium]